jgi:pimeloyl-ACP methyl ester carboxylesterase
MRGYVYGIFLTVAGLQAQDISGTWQGTLGEGTDKIRMVVRITKVNNQWSGTLFSIDQGPDSQLAQPLSSLNLQAGSVTFKVDEKGMFGAFEGALNRAGASITGAWSQGGYRQPLTFVRATKKSAWKDPSQHSIRFVTVDRGVRLEVLDWGGSGRAILLLAGNGNSAHVFDALAAKLAASYRVYGLTRRGFGSSSEPPSGYDADRLGDDILAAIHALKIDKPVLIGHSIAGEELSSIGSRHPERIAGLVYLDAGYSYAYYDPALRDADLAGLDFSLLSHAPRAVWEGRRQYTRIQAPVLAIYAFGERTDPRPAEAQANAFEKGVLGSHVVRFPNAPHYIFVSNEVDVLREISAFIATLP